MEYSNTLRHYGIKGQKWGIRRFQNKNGTLTPDGKKRYSDDYKKAHDKKDHREMSDNELRSRINRLQMEQTYSKLTASTKNTGKQYIDKIIKVGTTVAALTSTGLTVYNNIDRIVKLLDKGNKKK